ncbi:response regulator transcription factor [Nocardioides sp. C4-1]|uniref:response regulator transcription factor n=1 Tax=Nocardioides sp. C4-1 TaxID=3151851 RepID=UPI0032665C79
MPRAGDLMRLVVVEDHVLFAESLETALTLEGHHVDRVEVAAHATTTGLVAAALRSRPQVALLDLDLGAQTGLRLVAPLTQAGVAVVVVTGEVDEARWGECLRSGARAVLSKTGSLNSILAAIRRIGEGRAVMTHDERRRLLEAFHVESSSSRLVRGNLDKLTRREQVVLGHLMDGRPVREIARAAFVSEATVRTQVKSILAKLQVTSQLAAVGAAHSVRWHPTTGSDLEHGSNVAQ